MPNTIIFESVIVGYESLTWKGQDIYKRYPQIYTYLMQELGKDYAELIARPHLSESILSGNGKARWTSETFTSNATPLSKLNDTDRKDAETLLVKMVSKINEFIRNLKESSNQDNKDWSEILELAFTLPDNRHVLFENGKIVFFAWGLKFSDKNKISLGLTKNIEIPKTREKSAVPNEIDENDLTENPDENADTSKIKNDSEVVKIEPDVEHQVIKDKYNVSTKTENDENFVEPLIKKEAEIVDPPKENDESKLLWWRRNKKWLLLFLFILCILILICILFCDKKDKSFLPDSPNVIVPIDSTKIVSDPDSVRYIAGDRLNIILKGEHKDINEFAQQFKKAYPGNQYKIIYYDTMIYRIQIQVPVEQLKEIQDEIKSKLSDFDMLIYHESIFNRNYIPRDPGFSDPNKSWYHSKIKTFEAWDKSMGVNDVIVAVIDDGFDLNHPEFAGKIVMPWNLISRSQNVYGSKPGLSHGTHVAGIAIGLADNGNGISGIAPKCKFMPLQIADGNGILSTTAIIDAILYAINNGADVINISLGQKLHPRFAALPVREQEIYAESLFKEEELFWNDLFSIAYESNVIIVIAAGNDNAVIGMDPMQRSTKTIKVSAISPEDEKAPFSNFGSLSTISAPGIHIYSSIPNNAFDFYDGTSMAAPIVSGGIALLKSVNPALSFDEIVDLIQSTGIPVNNNDRHIGNIIQLDKLLGIAYNKRRTQPIVKCPDMQNKIDRLLQEIEKIKRECQDSLPELKDTLKIPENPQNFDFAVGRWKSTTYLYRKDNGEKVTLYFDFYANGNGKITLVEEDNTNCVAELDLNITNRMFIINQLTSAKCLPFPDEYIPYKFECIPDATGCAECTAINKLDNMNIIKFSLIKIR